MNLRTSITIRYAGGSESSATYDGGDTDNMPRIYRALSIIGVKEVTYLVLIDNAPRYPSTTLKVEDTSERLMSTLYKVDNARQRKVFGGDVNACAAYLWGMIAMMEETYSHKEWWLQNYAIQCADHVVKGK